MEQSIDILQLSINKLKEYVYKEFEENPILN
ncbi:hypothetical protein [uncultured Clostridium sp.]